MREREGRNKDDTCVSSLNDMIHRDGNKQERSDLRATGEDRFQLSGGHSGGNIWINGSGVGDKGQNGDTDLRAMREIHGALVMHFEVKTHEPGALLSLLSERGAAW